MACKLSVSECKNISARPAFLLAYPPRGPSRELKHPTLISTLAFKLAVFIFVLKNPQISFSGARNGEITSVCRALTVTWTEKLNTKQ